MNFVFDSLAVSFRKEAAAPARRIGLLLPCVAATLLLGCSGSSSGVGSDGVGGTTSLPNVGGAVSSGGAVGTGGVTGAGGAVSGGAAQTGGSHATGGAQASTGGTPNTSVATGGSTATGGKASTGGLAATGGGSAGGRSSTGGAVPTGGVATTGGSKTTGGTTAVGGTSGATTTGGSKATGGTTAVGGAGGVAATGGTSAAGASSTGPCDIYATASTPCVAAHSLVRALYGAYSGNLYQVRRASDKTTKDVPVLAPGGFANTSVQDTFCTGTTCTISILYDQTTNHNDLVKSPKAYWLANGGTEANASDGKITVSGHTVHGIYVTGYSTNVAYRNNATKGVATGDQAEAMYMVVDGKRFSNQCCFDYGNAETSGNDDGNGTMEAVYFGSDTTWGGTGSGSGPWVAADLENGVFKSDKGGWQTTASTPGALSIVATFATAMLKGPSGNHFTLKGGNAQSGTLSTMWDGVRPSPGYSPKKLQGAIILGTGGDGSNGGTGTFFEGAMTSGNPSDSVDNAIQANIIAAGYGK